MTGRSGGRSVVEDLAASGGLDELFERIDSGQVELTGSDGLLPALLKETLERGLAAELTEHLGYEKGEPTAVARGNARNGTTAKTISSEVGSFEIEVPRDRAGTFTPRLVRKGQRRMDGLDAMIISLYAGGMTVREIRHHLDSTLGAELNAGTISNITDAVADAVLQWQSRPLEEFYPVIHLDAIRVKIRDQGRVSNRAAHIAVGVDMEGIKHVLGIWVQADEGASFWAHVCAELANRGVNDVLIVCCDGLTGLAEAVEATWPDSVVQTCVVHLIRSSMRFVAYQDRKRVAAALKPVYTAASEDAASSALAEFAASPLGARYPDTVGVWERAWERFTPFLAFPPALRRVIYTANSIESLNYQLRKVSKNRGHFPNDTAAVKLLWLAICNIEDKRALERERDRGKPAGKRRAKPRLVEGQTTTNWKQALAQLTTAYPDRINPYL
ncbi:IS256 family transposase [Propionibacterium acidifaciens]|nr:IS256 family transposase [Propionibacterium acidifaciens]AYW77580.1 IS256 family transposase [Propionibacterium acidifaciens]